MKYSEVKVTFSGGFREVFHFNLPIGRAHKHWAQRLYREVREFFCETLKKWRDLVFPNIFLIKCAESVFFIVLSAGYKDFFTLFSAEI